MKKTIIILLSSFFVFGTSLAQSKKTVINKEIQSKISYDYDLKGNKDIQIKRLIEIFDTKGNIVEEIIFNKEGKQTKHYKYTYNDDNKIIKKVSFTPNKKLKKTTDYTFKNGLKVSKTVKDEKGLIIEKQTYSYTYK